MLLVPCHSFLMPEWIIFLYSYDLSLKAFSVGLLNLFRLKSSRNKRLEPYYYPLIWRALRGGRLTIQSREIPHGIYIRSLGKSLSSETKIYIVLI